MELTPKKSKKNNGISSEFSISTSLALKCRNLSLGYPKEMIPIPNKNRTPKITD